MKNAIVFSMIVLALVGYLNLGGPGRLGTDDSNARSTTHQCEAIDEGGAYLGPGDPPPGANEPRQYDPDWRAI